MKPCLPKAKRTGCLLISLPAARSQSRSRSCRLLASCQMGHLRGKARREGAFRGRRFGDRSSSEWKNLRFSGLERLNSWWGDRCLFQEATRSQLLHQDRLDWVGFLNASQTLVETLEFERQEGMINPGAKCRDGPIRDGKFRCNALPAPQAAGQAARCARMSLESSPPDHTNRAWPLIRPRCWSARVPKPASGTPFRIEQCAC